MSVQKLLGREPYSGDAFLQVSLCRVWNEYASNMRSKSCSFRSAGKRGYELPAIRLGRHLTAIIVGVPTYETLPQSFTGTIAAPCLDSSP